MTHAPVNKKRQDGNELEEVKIVPPDGGWGKEILRLKY